MAIKETIQGVQHDQLMGGPEIAVLTKNITITAGAVIKRGTLMTTTAATGKATAKGEVADSIMAYDTTATDTVATVYISGRFNRECAISATGDTVAVHEEELRDKNIYFTSLK